MGPGEPLPSGELQALPKATATGKKLRPARHGGRCVLAGPPVLVERQNRERGGRIEVT